MNFVAKCCQPPGILGDFAVDRWKFIDFTRPGILRPSPCTDKKWNSPLVWPKLSSCIQLRLMKHPSQKVMNFRHLFSCDTIVKV